MSAFLSIKDEGGGVRDGVSTPGSSGLTHAEIVTALETHYPRLKGLVRARMGRLTRRPLDQFTDSPTVHANDICMALLQQRQPVRDAEHLMAIATLQCMRIVVDYLRRRRRLRRGGGSRRVSIDQPDQVEEEAGVPIIDRWLLQEGINDALARLVDEHPRVAQVLMLRVFLDRSIADVAAVLDLSTATVERDLRQARVYLRALLD